LTVGKPQSYTAQRLQYLGADALLRLKREKFMKSKHRLLVVVAFLLSTGACSHGEESECAKYIAMLGGQTPYSAFDSIKQSMCQDALEPLNEMFDPLGGGRGSDIVRLVIELWDPDVSEFPIEAEKFSGKKKLYAEILKKGLTSPTTAVLAASAISDWGIDMQELRPDLIVMLKDDLERSTPKFVKAYINALDAVLVVEPESADEQVYIKLLSSTHDVPGYSKVLKQSASALGKLRSKSDDAIQALMMGLFYYSKSGEIVSKEAAGYTSCDDKVDHLLVKEVCIDSLLKIGKPAVPFLMNIITLQPGSDEIAYMEDYTITNGVSDWRWRRGYFIPMIIGQLRDDDSAMALLHDMIRPMVTPGGMSPALQEDWTNTQTNRLKMESSSLMSIGNTPEFYKTALKAIRNVNTPVEARLDLALALAFKQTPEAIDTLFSVIFEEEAIEDDEGVIKVKDSDMPPPSTQADFVINFMLPLSLALDYPHLELFDRIFDADFEEIFAETKQAHMILEMLKKDEIQLLVNVVRVCKNDYKKWLGVFRGQKVRGEDDLVFDPSKIADEFLVYRARTKAVLALSQWSGLTSKKRIELVDFIIDTYKGLKYSPDFDDFRKALVLSLERLGKGDKEVLKKVETLLSEECKKEKLYGIAKFWNQQLKALIYFLQRT
jgi:hypothetical protein